MVGRLADMLAATLPSLTQRWRVVVCVAFIVVFGATDDPDADPLAAAKKNKDLGNNCFKNGLYESAISVRMHLRL